MKRSPFIFAVLLALLIAALLTACTKNETLTATVLEVSESAILVEPDEGTSARASADKVYFSCENASEFSAGDRVEIVFGGAIAESYPAQAKAKSVKLIEGEPIPTAWVR